MAHDMQDPVTHYRTRGGELFLAVLGKYVYGCCAVTAEGELLRLTVHPSARGKGIARLLCRRVEEFCQAAGLTKVWLTTGGWMSGAIGLYDALGYERGKLFDIPVPKGSPGTSIPIQEFVKNLAPTTNKTE